jgi:hypothetical protein
MKLNLYTQHNFQVVYKKTIMQMSKCYFLVMHINCQIQDVVWHLFCTSAEPKLLHTVVSSTWDVLS